MISKYYKIFKNYILGNDFEQKEDLFEKIKIEVIFNLTLIFSIIYLAGFINILVNGYWYLLIIRLVGVVLFLWLFYSLKQTKDYHLPSAIWAGGIALFGIVGLLINSGKLTFSNLGFALLNMAIVMLLLNKKQKIFYSLFYIIYLSFSLAVSFNMIPLIQIGIDFSYDKAFFENNLIFTLTPFLLLVFVFHNFVTYEYQVKMLLISQINKVKEQEEQMKIASDAMYKSVKYASKIQETFLPNLEKYKPFFNKHFLFLKPRNELSGDFYWVGAKGDNLYLAVIDSAENNISGAIIGSVYFNALDWIIEEMEDSKVNDMIANVNQFIESKIDLQSLKKAMNLSLVKIDTFNNKLFFSSEKNSLFVAKKQKKIISEYKARFTLDDNNVTSFQEESLDYEIGDKLYLTSDGMALQFKGFDNDKFKHSVFKSFLKSIKNEDIATQKELLDSKLTQWTGGKLQTDDVCIIGLEL